ncbi:MAG: AAA family ATPase [Thermoanaerobaculia bacterium]|nr:AAA family ATPase [Thermoanaerobaculia bacterium]
MKLPYGIADFRRLIFEGYLYLDRTAHIRQLEALGSALVFLRPRRFGKSLWLGTLASYYDLRLANEHERLFGQLAIGREPTSLAHRYFVLRWNFSEVEARGGVEDLTERLDAYVSSTIRVFLQDYKDHLPATLTIRPHATDTLRELLAIIRQTPYRLYLMIDEYDNFANEVMLADETTYRGLVHSDGPFRNLMKSVKSAMEGQGLERVFLTGISPIVLSDLTSGFNITKNVSQHPALNDLCGFREEEVEALLRESTMALRAAQASRGLWNDQELVSDALEMARVWYDGYSFSPSATQRVYNPTLVLYFLDRLQDYHEYPANMLDANLAIDQDKLSFLAREIPGQQVILDLVQTGEPIEAQALVEGFSLADVLRPRATDLSSPLSFLYYFGMLTLEGRTAHRSLLLRLPNLVIKGLFLDNVRALLLAEENDPWAMEDPAQALLQRGDIAPLSAYIEERVFRRFSNLDYRWMNELAIKTAFLALLFKQTSHVIVSEPELDRGRADLLLQRRPDANAPDLFDLLLELKYVKPRDLGIPVENLRTLSREELLTLEPVRTVLAQAERQLTRYRDALSAQHRSGLRLSCWVVVALGFERLLTRELPVV